MISDVLSDAIAAIERYKRDYLYKNAYKHVAATKGCMLRLQRILELDIPDEIAPFNSQWPKTTEEAAKFYETNK